VIDERGASLVSEERMIDHIGFPVSDYERSKAFYAKALAPLGYVLVMEVDQAENDHRAAVDAFHRAAIAAGGADNGPPGLRPHYHPNYYAAFARDPDGHNLEAVCHLPE
jgi:catechol 2,3-dioxygenase-like lactoylglutathione lyase family enzyme